MPSSNHLKMLRSDDPKTLKIEEQTSSTGSNYFKRNNLLKKDQIEEILERIHLDEKIKHYKDMTNDAILLKIQEVAGHVREINDKMANQVRTMMRQKFSGKRRSVNSKKQSNLEVSGFLEQVWEV